MPPQGGCTAPKSPANPLYERQQGLPPHLPAQEDMVAPMRLVHIFRAAVGIMTRHGMHHVQIDDM